MNVWVRWFLLSVVPDFEWMMCRMPTWEAVVSAVVGPSGKNLKLAPAVPPGRSRIVFFVLKFESNFLS